MGLGLSLVRSIIQAHGADIQVISSPNQGSTFRIEFLRPIKKLWIFRHQKFFTEKST